MADLHILSVECLTKEDSNANDEVTLQVDGTAVFGPQKMTTGDVVNLVNSIHPFTGTVAVSLIEEDPDVHDFIGTVPVPDTLPGFVDQTGRFHAARPNAHYHMRYHIHP